MLCYRNTGKTYRGLFRRTPALHDFSLQIDAGEIVGLIGANGAGKTTAIMIALGYLRPTSGDVCVLDAPPGDPSTRSRIGWVPDEPIYSRGATARGLIEQSLNGYGLTRVAARTRAEELLARFDLTAAARRRISTFSLGMQQKVSLALALGHRPELLILDEPFSALDHRAVMLVRDELESFREAGGAVLISSHHLSELELVCTRAVYVHGGAIRREELLNSDESTAFVRIEVQDEARTRQILESSTSGPLSDWKLQGGVLTGRIDSARLISDLVALLSNGGAGVSAVSSKRAQLEQTFLQLERGD
jgi:ABC-2 type transport system ATP-binding protein